MERRLKERLIGAAILVALIVLVVPELLSGPKQTVKTVAPLSTLTEPTRTEATRTVTVDLDTKKTMALEAQPEDSVTASAPPQPEPPEALPPIQTAAVPAAPAAIENHAVPPKSWSVQLGSFASHANAEQLVRAVKAHNSPAYVLTSGAGRSMRYRVRVGPLADRPAAERMLAKLKGEGHAASVVAP